MADPSDLKPRVLFDETNPAHRARVEHNANTILVHLSDEGGKGWTVLAVDRGSRQWAVAQARTQRTAAERAFESLYGGGREMEDQDRLEAG
jgi:hypothetical protein